MAANRMSRLILNSLINDVIAGLDAESTSETRWDDVCDGGGWLDRGGADFTDECAAAFDEEFHIALDAAFVAKAEDDEVPSLVDGEHATGDSCEALFCFFLTGCLLDGNEFAF